VKICSAWTLGADFSWFLPAERQNTAGIAVVVEIFKILISVPGMIFLFLIAGAILVSATASHTRAGKIMVGLFLLPSATVLWPTGFLKRSKSSTLPL
jgi:hypothetical protein